MIDPNSLGAVPQAPSLASVASKFTDIMKGNPDQATQIMTCIGVFKHAKEGKAEAYDQYCQICSELDVQPVPRDRWDEHDVSVFRRLISASLAKNIPGCKLEPADIDRLIECSDAKNAREAGQAILTIIMKGLGATSDVTAGWVKLGTAALNCFM